MCACDLTIDLNVLKSEPFMKEKWLTISDFTNLGSQTICFLSFGKEVANY